jgi:threonine/homoserine/homoserine lactone efflux protein
MAQEVLSAPAGGPILTLVLASLVIMGSPGPSTMSVTAVGAAFGLRDSLAYLGGVILWTLAVLLSVATGVVALLLSLPQLAPALAVASAAYILYLAFRIATAPPLSEAAQSSVAPSFAGGFALAIINPKAYVAIAAVFASTTLGSGFLDTVLKTAILGIMIVAIHVCWLFAGASLSRILRHPVASRLLNLLFAVTLVLTTVPAFIR